MVKPIGCHTGYDPINKTPEVLHELQMQYGSQLQTMNRTAKMLFRAALADYIFEQVKFKELSDDINACVERLWFDAFEEEPEVALYILKCQSLSQGDMEGLIEALSEQIRAGV